MLLQPTAFAVMLWPFLSLIQTSSSASSPFPFNRFLSQTKTEMASADDTSSADSNSFQFPPITDSSSTPSRSDSNSIAPTTDPNPIASTADSSSTTPSQRDRNRRISMLLPLLLSLARQQESASGSDSEFRVLMVNGRTGVVLIVEGNGDVDALFEQLSSKSGVSPASKASVEAMPRVVISEEDVECTICLDTYEIGSEAREMPCKHKFHSECIEKWLGIHGTCPICRYVMPAEEKRENSGGDEGRGGREDGSERREPAFTVRMWMRTRNSSGSHAPIADSGSESESLDGSTTTTPNTDLGYRQ